MFRSDVLRHGEFKVPRKDVFKMAKVLRCSDTGILDCSWEGRAETEEELLRQAKEHAAVVHGETEFSAEEIASVRAAIRDE